MDNRKDNTFSFLLFPILVALFAGGLLGWAIGSYVAQSKTTQTTSVIPGIGGGPSDTASINYSSDASNFRVRINSLLKEHGVLTSEYLAKIYDGDDVEIIKSNLDSNSDLISNEVGNIYGANTKNEFLRMWNTHIDQYEKYTDAIKSKNQNDTNEASEALREHAVQMGAFLSRIDNNFSAQRIANLFNEHARITLDVIDSHADQDEQAKIDSMKKSYDQAGIIADYIGQIIVNSHPDKVQ